MNDQFHFRSQTYDAGIYNTVVVKNEYRLPTSFSHQDRILDIGSHIGAFAYAALVRGSHFVYAVEAEEENYQLSLQNLQPFIKLDRVRMIHKAVWGSDISDSRAVFTGYYQSSHSNKINSGGGSIAVSRIPGYRYVNTHVSRIETVAFDDIVRHITNNGEKHIRLLKLDCEGAEWPILLTSKTLHLVDEICGEYHEIGGQYSKRQATFTIPGHTEFTGGILVSFLQSEGFLVDHHTHGHPREALGMFFAKR